MRISQLAEATGVPAKTIRFYESAGIMPPASRRPNAYREYGDDDLCGRGWSRCCEASSRV